MKEKENKVINLTIGGQKYRLGADLDWIRNDLAVGGGIYDARTMADVKRQGVTAILNMSNEDDTELAKRFGIVALWNPINDDLEVKDAEIFKRGVDFAHRVLAESNSKLLIHCACGMHRAPMMTLAILGSFGWGLGAAQKLMKQRRPIVNFPDVYVASVRWFLSGEVGCPPSSPHSRWQPELALE